MPAKCKPCHAALRVPLGVSVFHLAATIFEHDLPLFWINLAVAVEVIFAVGHIKTSLLLHQEVGKQSQTADACQERKADNSDCNKKFFQLCAAVVR
jgi:hypothetical protein